MHIYILRLPCLSQKIYINCLKHYVDIIQFLTKTRFREYLSFYKQKKNQCLFLTNLFHKSNLALLPKCRREKNLRVLHVRTRMVFHSLNQISFKINKDSVF